MVREEEDIIMKPVSKVGKSYYILLPKKIRDRWGLKKGDMAIVKVIGKVDLSKITEFVPKEDKKE